MQHPLPFVISQEGAKLAGVGMVMEGDKKVLVELECCGELDHDLPHAVQELSEDG